MKSHSLDKVQKLLEDCDVKKIQKVDHTRWLSHLDAVTSIRDTFLHLENEIESGSDRVCIGSGPSVSADL